jgi:glycosyltransferase involved in cell wall biosynthesis
MMRTGAGRALVVMPAWNERERIGPLLSRMRGSLAQFDIVVVDDGSRDGTQDLVRSAGVSLLSLPLHLGYGAAVKTGCRHALGSGYDYAVLMDADGQHEPLDAPAVLAPVQDGRADLSIGSPYLVRQPYDGPPLFLGHPGWLPRLGRLIERWLAGALVGRGITYACSGYRAMNRKTMMRLLDDDCPSDFSDLNTLILLRAAGLRIVEVPARIYAVRSLAESRYFNMRGVFTHLYRVLGIAGAAIASIPSLRTRRER